MGAGVRNLAVPPVVAPNVVVHQLSSLLMAQAAVEFFKDGLYPIEGAIAKYPVSALDGVDCFGQKPLSTLEQQHDDVLGNLCRLGGSIDHEASGPQS